MLTNTFVHAPGVGHSTEKHIWASGVRDWQEFLARPTQAGLSSRQTGTLEEHLLVSLERLTQLDHRFFRHFLAPADHWRIWPEFARKTAYLDIETTGLAGRDTVTVIGLHDGTTMRWFVKGRERRVTDEGNGNVLPLSEFEKAIEPYGVLVTFFGSAFDLPFLRRDFGDLKEGRIHLDLCFLLRRLGFSGGLKRIEQMLGLARSRETAGLDGWDAVRLWQEYTRGSREALELLLRYNQEDVENLQPLLSFACRGLRRRSGLDGFTFS